MYSTVKLRFERLKPVTIFFVALSPNFSSVLISDRTFGVAVAVKGLWFMGFRASHGPEQCASNLVENRVPIPIYNVLRLLPVD